MIDGADVLPVLTGKAATVQRQGPLYWRLNMAPPKENLHMALRDGDWKMLAAALGFSHMELYNLKSRPARDEADLKDKEPEAIAPCGIRLEH